MKNIIIVLFILTFILHLFYFSKTTYDKLPNDIIEHTNVIKLIVQHHQLPKPKDCWECYHPPLYYLAGAGIYTLFNIFGVTDEFTIFRTIQFISVLIYFALLVVGYRIFQKVFDNNNELLIATSLLLFWPSGYVHANRIANDTLAFLLVVVSLYFLIKWWRHQKFSYLLFSVLFASLGILVKSTATLMVFVIFLGFCYKSISNLKDNRRLLLGGFCLFLLPLFSLLINQRNFIFNQNQDDQFIGNIGSLLGTVYSVNNTALHLFGFDVISYLQYSNISPDNDQGGRQFFLNYLIKTSLFTELKPVTISQEFIAGILSLLSIILLFGVALGILKLVRSRNKYFLPMIMMICVFVAGALYSRVRYPIAQLADFRYIFPVIIPILFLMVSSLQMLNKYKIFYFGYITILIAFMVLSCIYFLV